MGHQSKKYLHKKQPRRRTYRASSEPEVVNTGFVVLPTSVALRMPKVLSFLRVFWAT